MRTNLERYLALGMQMLMARLDGRDEDPYLHKLDEVGLLLTDDEKAFCDEMGKDWSQAREGDGHLCIADPGVPCSLCGRVSKET